MIEVYFSHIGEAPLVSVDKPEPVEPGKLREILSQIEARHSGFHEEVLDQAGEHLNSATMVFKRIEIDADGRLLEGEHTSPVKDLDEIITDEDENLLIALFHPERLMEFLLETLARTDNRFEYTGGSVDYRSYISGPNDRRGGQPLFVQGEPEQLYSFTNGRLVGELVTDDLVDVSQDRLIPVALRDAIGDLWELEDDFRLRLFQEEALVHILGELSQSDDKIRRPLLLSIPTGGGKTEAFLIPLVAHLYDRREHQLRAGHIPEPAVRSIVVYPTRALANDQARRIAEILYQMNQEAVEDRKISVGVLTGDTPGSGYNLLTEKSLLQLCPRCSAVLTTFREKTIQDSGTTLTIARCICGAEIDYFRLTRYDILNQPPDILITSPDMINRMLQSPRYHTRIFSPEIDVVIFDEIHMYESVFGCNVAHLLRRFEEACQRRPLYVGVSATIRNAKELACLIFDTDLEEVFYLRPKGKDEPETEEKRPYLNYEVGPARYRHHYAVAPVEWSSGRFQKVTTSVLNVADVIGHLVRDPHFRKTLIFSNFRQNTDDVVRFLRDQEDRYYRPYQRDLLPRLLATLGAQGSTEELDLTRTEAQIVSAVDRWHRQARETGSLNEPPLEVGWHRGGLEREERIKAVNRFAAARRLSAPDEDNSELPIDVMVATRTLELGIDIGDVTTVMNCGAPFTVNEYTQRIGRGGRRKDSLALTVIDPRNPLDFYFLKHFNHYANPTSDDFEDAPIIVSNLEIVKSHLYARLLDRLARYLGSSGKEEIQAGDLRDFRLLIGGNYVAFSESWQIFSQALFDEIFTPTAIQRLQTWIRREAIIIPGICETEVTGEPLRSWWMDKCEQLYKRICTSDADIRDTDDLSGMRSKDRELVPDMRNSGPSVGLYLLREGGEDELRDTVSRRQAVNSRPVGGYASQGSVTFKIEAVKDRDPDTEERVRRLLLTPPDGTKAVQYFSRMFGDENNRSPFPDDPVEVLIKVAGFVTPRDLLVKYNPYRFYCPRCGATFSDKRAGDDRCAYCRSELRQLTEVYVCGGCGEIYLPPVPKVCLNPDCIEQAMSQRNGTPFLTEGYKRVGKGDRHNYYFRFTALPMLNWQCRSCGTEINYHTFYTLSPVIQNQVAGAAWGTDSSAQIAKSFLYTPESWWGKTYDQDGFHRARFNCPKCKKANTYRKIYVKNIPSFRSVVHEYIIHGPEIAPEQSHALGTSRFERVSVVAMAREQFRRFYSYRERETQVDLGLIFPDSNSYLANTYDTHAAFFHLNKALERFLETDATALSCYEGVGCICRTFAPQGEADDEEADAEMDMTRPVPALLPWELDRKPDPRRKWCNVVQGLVTGATCPGQEALCEQCQHFERKRYLRYLILHTLKHAIITAMPKYTGVNKNLLRGTIYPNDEQDYDLALVDLVEGGSGCLYLLRKNWAQIWEIVGELLDAARSERGELLLAYTCARYNRDLCPHLTYAFYEYVSS